VSWKSGKVTIETLWYGEENDGVIVLRKQGSAVQDITDAVAFAVSGQPLVQGGSAAPVHNDHDPTVISECTSRSSRVRVFWRQA
jgi:hypothetical protein